jgi:hypothetical protein
MLTITLPTGSTRTKRVLVSEPSVIGAGFAMRDRRFCSWAKIQMGKSLCDRAGRSGRIRPRMAERIRMRSRLENAIGRLPTRAMFLQVCR